MKDLVSKLAEAHTRRGEKVARTTSEALGRAILSEMRNTSNPELALQVAKEKLARDVSSYSEEAPPRELSRRASRFLKWARVSEEIEEPMGDDAVTAVVMELAASSEFPALEDWDKYGFMLDAPNELTEVVDPGGFPAEEPRPYDGWDVEEPDSMGPHRHRNRRSPRK